MRVDHVAFGRFAQNKGVRVLVRFASIVTLCASLAACAQTPILPTPDFGTSDLQAVPSLNASEMQHLGHQTFAGKVLTAIALERVTGLKPDPARFSDID